MLDRIDVSDVQWIIAIALLWLIIMLVISLVWKWYLFRKQYKANNQKKGD